LQTKHVAIVESWHESYKFSYRSYGSKILYVVLVLIQFLLKGRLPLLMLRGPI